MGAGPISRREFFRKLRTFDFDGPHTRKNHPFMRKDKFKLTVPNKHGPDIDGQMVDKILKQADIELDKWNDA